MHEDVVDYYDKTFSLYKKVWYMNGDSNALHYGFWDKDTKSRNEALNNTNKYLAEKAQIQREEKVLDAGCGVGGSCFWLAKNIGADATGITISKRQLEEARNLTAKYNTKNTKFFLKSYLDTGFEDETFDVAWAIESTGYAGDSLKLSKEMFRVLKKNGRFIVADGLLKKTPVNRFDKWLLKKFREGFALPEFSTTEEFVESLRKAGFKEIDYESKLKDTMPSVIRIFIICLFTYPIFWLLEKLKISSARLTKNSLTGITQYLCVKRGIGEYSVILARK